MSLPSNAGDAASVDLDELRRRLADVTAERDALSVENQRQRRLLDTLPIKVFLKDKDSRFLLVNEAFAAELGVSAAEVVGKSDLDFYPRPIAENYRADDRWVMRQKGPVTTIVRQSIGGHDVWVEVIKAAVFDDAGRPAGVLGLLADVTERKEAQEALENERYLLASLMDNIPDSVYFKDAASRFIRINKALAARIGLRETSQAIGKTDFDFFSKEHAEKAFLDEQRVLSSGRPLTNREEKEVLPDGRVRWVLTTKMPLRDPAGRIIGTFGVSHDITQRKWAEEEIVRQKGILQSVLDSISDGVAVADESGRLVLFNPAAAWILGSDATGERAGPPSRWSERFGLFLPDDSGPFPTERLPLVRAMAGESVDGEEMLVRRPGRTQPVFISVDARPLRDASGRVKGAVAAFRDVTLRKASEEALRRSEERYRELFENANDVVYTHTLTGQITSFNKAGETITGYTREEARELNVTDLVAPEYRARALAMTERKLAGLGSTTYEIEILAKDGRRVLLEVSTRLIHEGGKPVGVQGIARDVTERKRNQEALERQAALLARQAEELERRNQELSEAYAELKEAESQLIQSEKFAAVGQLVAGLAHEINNPAAFVLTNLSVIERDLEDLRPYWDACRALEEWATRSQPDMAEPLRRLRVDRGLEDALAEVPAMLDSAKRGMNRIRELVANLRAYSRIEFRGEYVLGDLVEGLKATLVLIAPSVPKGVRIEHEPAELPLVECNLGQINQVFMNLIVNAVQAVGGEGSVRIETAREGDGVLVRIRDTGEGIPVGIRSRIFDPFFTTKEVGKGTGLGLSISRRIIDAHGGTIEFDSQEGKGTEFRVWLPLRQARSAGAASEGDEVHLAGGAS